MPRAHGAKPHSAPTRGLELQAQSHKLKFLRTRSNAVKEIEEWAKEGRSTVQNDVAIGRNSGTQLSDNVTEERMLQARLMELSKERYKFINQITYEKKMFLDRQQRKSSALKERLKNVSLDTSNRFKSKSAGTPSSRSSLKRSSSRRRSLKRKPVRDEDARPQTVPPRLEELPHIDIPPLTPHIFQTEPLIPESKFTGPGQDGLPRLTTPMRAVKFPDELHPRTKPPPRKKSQKTPAINGPTHDPRYQHLEHSLCENYVLPSGAQVEQVSDIVGRIEALSVKAKVHRDAKPKLAMKAYQFLAQKGVLVNT